MACRAGSASHTDSPRRREPGSGPGLQREWVLGFPVIRVRPENRNGDRRLLASTDLHFENLAGNDTRSRRSKVRDPRSPSETWECLLPVEPCVDTSPGP